MAPFSTPALALTTFTLLARLTTAQADSFGTVTHGSVVIMRTGERQPTVDTYTDPGSLQLTADGANQAYANGQVMRNRYISSVNATNVTTTIQGLPLLYSPDFVAILAGGLPAHVATAQSFMQGLYPSVERDQSNLLPDMYDLYYSATGAISQTPNGYQYPFVQVASDSDERSLIIDGSSECLAFRDHARDYAESSDFSDMYAATQDFYNAVADQAPVDLVPYDLFSYGNAFLVAEYVTFMVRHNETWATAFGSGNLSAMNALPRLQWYSDYFNFKLYGDPQLDPDAGYDQIATIAGQTAAGAVYSQLGFNKASEGNSSKLSLVFADFEPFVSFFQMSGLAGLNSNFTGMPRFASMMAFELYSVGDATSPWPSDDQLMVRFMFGNGTDEMQEYPLFQQPDAAMSWATFEERMQDVMLNDVSSWCNTCHSQVMTDFCVANNISAAYQAVYGAQLDDPANDSGDSPPSKWSISTTAAGVIGAVATLVFIGILLILGVSCLGLRFTRVQPTRPEGALGGFRGNQKLASDPDLTSPKQRNGVFVTESEPKPRVGSWELKDGQGPQRPANMRHEPLDDDHFEQHHFGASVEPAERV